MLKYLRKYWIFGVLSIVFMIAEVQVDMLQPKLMADIVDNGILGSGNGGIPDFSLIRTTGLQMILIVITGGICGTLSGTLANLCSQNYGNSLRKACFERIMRMSFEQTDAFTTGSLITRITNDITQVERLVAQSVRGFVRCFMFLVVGTMTLMSLNVHFLTVVVCAFPLILIEIGLVLWKTNPLFNKLQQRIDSMNSIIQEDVGGVRVIKAFIQEDREEARFRKANDALVDTQLRVLILMSYMRPVMNIILNLATVALIYIGALQVKGGNMHPGEVMAGVTYLSQILGGMMMLAMIFQTLSRGFASGRRIREILDTIPTIRDGADPEAGKSASYDSLTGVAPMNDASGREAPSAQGLPANTSGSGSAPHAQDLPANTSGSGGAPHAQDLPVNASGSGSAPHTQDLPADTQHGSSVIFRRVSFAYPGRNHTRVLRNINLEIHAGETFAIIGATGCGKTTLANLIPRFYDATRGTVEIDGIDVKNYNLTELRDKVAFVTQKAELFSTTIRENIALGRPGASDEEIARAATVAQADDFIREQPDGYNTAVAEGGMSVSGGQKQRISLARALLKGAPILILDDATSALDLRTEAAFYDTFDREYRGTTRIVIAQRIATAQRADRIAVLANSKIVDCGSHDELLGRCKVYQEIYNSQMRREGGADHE